MKFNRTEAAAAYEESTKPQLLADGWYAPVRITGAEFVESGEKKSKGLKIQVRFTRPDGKPFSRTFSIWFADKNGVQNGFARTIHALAVATDAYYKDDEGDDAIVEVSMVGGYLALRLNTDKPKEGSEYEPKNGIGGVRPYTKNGTHVFAGDVKALDKPDAPAANEGARATATMQAQADQQVATQRAQAGIDTSGPDPDDEIPF